VNTPDSEMMSSRTLGIPHPVDMLSPPAWEIIAIAGLVAFYVLGDTLYGTDFFAFANNAGPVFLAAILMTSAWVTAQEDAVVMWLGLFWFRITTAVYFGIGSMIHIFYNDTTLHDTQMFFYALPENFFKYNTVIAVCVFFVLLYIRMFATIFKPPKPHPTTDSSDSVLLVCAVGFGGLGYLIKYAISIPHNLNLYGDAALPGMINSLSLLAPVGLFLMTLWCVRHAPRYIFAISLLLALDIFTGSLLFNKSEVLTSALVFTFALLQYKITRTRLVAAGLSIIFLFQALVPMVEFGRNELSRQRGNISEATLTDRFEIMAVYWGGNTQTRTGEEFQGSLARIAYATSSIPAILLYDNGLPGNSLDNIFVVLIPRMLWPEKPILNTGEQYNQLVSGRSGSASWMGIFAESYWNYGWWGAPLLMFAVAAAYFFIGRMTIRIMAERRWFHFPVVLLGMGMGIRTDGELLLGIGISALIALVANFVGNAFDGVVRPLIEGSQKAVPQPLAR